MPRSGSTWLYNAIRLVLSSDAEIRSDLAFGWIGDWEGLPDRRYTLIKVHEFEQQLVDRADFVFYSYRDVRDALASAVRKFGVNPSLGVVDYYINMYEKWTAVADLVVSYEDIVENKQETIGKLGAVLGIHDLDAPAIEHAIDSMRYEGEGSKNEQYNEVNLFHKGHITDGRHGSWEGFLEPELIRQIEKSHKSWFERRGYPLSSGAGG